MTRGAHRSTTDVGEAEQAMLGRDCFAEPLVVAGPRWKAGRPRVRQRTSENWAENSRGPKKEGKKEILFHFQDYIFRKKNNLEIAR
jgi:hypothetical protein